MKLKVEKCGKEKVEDVVPHWEKGAIYEYTTGGYYYCFEHQGILRLINLSAGTASMAVSALSKTSNRKLSKGECITLTVE